MKDGSSARAWNNLGLRSKGLVVIGIPLFAVLLFASLFFVANQKQKQEEAIENRSQEIRVLLRDMLTNLLNAETGVRGFILTDDPSFLEPFHTAVRSYSDTIWKLKRASVADTVQSQNVAALERLTGSRYESLRIMLDEKKKGKLSADSLDKMLAQGKSIMDSVRSTLMQMLEYEDRTLERARNDLSSSRARTAGIVIAGTVFALLGGVAATSLFTTGITERIHLLSENARRLPRNEELLPVPPGTDEMGLLAGELQKAQELLREGQFGRRKAEEQLERFFTLSLDLLCIAGFDGYFQRINPSWQKTLGYSEDELLTHPYMDFVHPEDRDGTAVEAGKLSGGELVLAFENRYQAKDGSYRWLLWNSTPVKEEAIIYAAARDITDRKKMEQQVQKLNQELEARLAELTILNQELEAFSYSVSHDLRAPLRHISGFVDLLKKKSSASLDEQGLRYVNLISESAKQMGELIDDLLVFSRMGRTEMRKMNVNMGELTNDVLKEFENDIKVRDIEIQIDRLPLIKADPSMMKLVLRNLISNALKYTARQTNTVIRIGSSSHQGDFTFFIQDNGIGFDMQYAHKLFGVFQRLHNEQEFEGTGIGLANVRRIIHRHGGTTWAEGTPGCGATFYFSIPKTDEEKAYL